MLLQMIWGTEKKIQNPFILIISDLYILLSVNSCNLYQNEILLTCLFVSVTYNIAVFNASMTTSYMHMSRVMRKTDFCLCKNKGADQFHSKCEADQRLCFRYTDSTISLLLKSKISSFWPASVTVQVDLCQTWSETPKTGFLALRLT